MRECALQIINTAGHDTEYWCEHSNAQDTALLHYLLQYDAYYVAAAAPGGNSVLMI